MIMTKKKTITFIIYYACLFGVWALTELLLYPELQRVITADWGIAIVRDVLIKGVVWILPAILFIKKNENNCPIKLCEMLKTKIPVKETLLMFALITVFVVGGQLFKTHSLSVSDSFGWDKVIVILFVGLMEESVFRGWLLNYTVDMEKPYIAIAVNAAMFLCIHFPIWITSGIFVESFTKLGFVSIIVLSVLFSLVFLKTKNILLTAALHSYYDLLVFLFVGSASH